MGCHALQNLTVNDVKQEKYYYRSDVIDTSLQQIVSNLYKYGQHCRSMPTLKVDPSDPSKGYITIGQPGLTKESIIIYIDFYQVNVNKTELKAYSYYSTWHKLVDEIIQAAKKPEVCN